MLSRCVRRMTKTKTKDRIPLLCFKEFLQPGTLEDTTVTIEQFSALLRMIGPFDADIVKRAHQLVQQPYFVGQVSNI